MEWYKDINLLIILVAGENIYEIVLSEKMLAANSL